MNGHQETSADTQETQLGSPAPSNRRRIIHFSSGETLEEEEEEEEEEVEEEQQQQQSTRRPPFSEPEQRTRLSFKSVAALVGRVSLLTCDFLGERLAGVLGLNAAKYQYAIDQHQREATFKSTLPNRPQTKGRRAPDQLTEEGPGETVHLRPGPDGGHYGATGDSRPPADPREKHVVASEGRHNRAYQSDDSHVK